MGTRADFYVGQGKDAEWIGSIGWDGYPDGVADEVLQAVDADSFRAAVASFFASRSDVTLPEHGWPWPWNDSGTTDYSYWHFDGKTWGSGFGHDLFPCDQDEPEEETGIACHDMPDMSARKSVAMDNRSGLIVIGA
jgi:hypothetical protein